MAPAKIGVARQLRPVAACLVFLGGHNCHDASGLARVGRVVAAVLEVERVVVDLDEDVGAGEFKGDEVVILVGVVGVVEVLEGRDPPDDFAARYLSQSENSGCEHDASAAEGRPELVIEFTDARDVSNGCDQHFKGLLMKWRLK